MKRKFLFNGISALALLSMTACSGEIHRMGQFGQVEYLAIDARQRLVLSGPGPDGNRVTCTEPSPDVFAVAAATAAAEGRRGTGDAAAAISAAFARGEAGGTIGLRTEAITLLRDAYFRACEGYLNGILTTDGYVDIVNQIDALMAALVGITSAGGTVAQAPVVISAGATAPSASAPGQVTGGQNSIGSVTMQSRTENAKVAEQIRQILRDYYDIAVQLRKMRDFPGRQRAARQYQHGYYK